MRFQALLSIAVVAGAVVAFGAEPAAAPASDWPAWRGPLANGVAPDATPPVQWSETQNVRWKVAIPGRGHSSPIVWRDRVYVTTAIETDKTLDAAAVKAAEADTPDFVRKEAHRPEKVLQFVVLALKRADGSVAWRQTVCEEAPGAGTHVEGSWASGSPVTDGERVYAYFGSHGLYCLDLDGNKKWEKRLGTMKTKANFGEGASPALCGDLILVVQDQEGPSFLVALDKRTGDEKWRVARDEKTSWATPLVVELEGRRQVVVSATKAIRSYDAATGTVLWQVGGMTGNVIPSPVADAGLVFCMSGFRDSALLAIRLAAAKGDLTGKAEAIAWSLNKDTPYVSSPLLYAGLLYFVKSNDGALSAFAADSGAVQYQSQRLEGIKQIFSSPVGAAGRIYVTGKNGVTLVLKAGPKFEVLASNKLDDTFTASAAIAGRELYLRGYHNLYCLGADRTE